MNEFKETKIITPLIDKYLLLRPKNPLSDKYALILAKGERKGGFHPSSLHKCAREIWYKYKDYEPDRIPTSVAQRCFDMGHAIEGCYTAYFEDMDEMEKKQPGIFNGFKLIGSNQKGENKELEIFYEYDKIVEVNKTQYLVDIKTTKDSDLGWGAMPHPGYIIQVQIYMFLTGIHNGVLLYQNKNTQIQGEYHFKYMPEIFEKIKNKIKYIKNCVKNKTIPKRENERTSQSCRWCDHQFTCWGERHK